MTAPTIDVMDETFVVAQPDELAERVGDPELWRRWWPGLRLEITADRGQEGLRWRVDGELTGTTEIWLEPWRDGVVVHWFLRADPRRPPRSARAAQRRHRRLVTTYKAGVHALKDELERDRPVGTARSPERGTSGWAERDRQTGQSRGPVDHAGAHRVISATMAAQTTSSIVVAASPADIMAVIADLEAYPEWTASVREVEVLTVYEDDERPGEARFVLDAGPIKDTYVLSYEWDGDDEVRWSLVEGGLIKELAGSYTLEQGDDGTVVTYQLTVDVAIPMLGLMKRKAEKVIIDTALKELKKRVESGTNQ